jgi:ribonuclease P protein component
LVAKRFGFPHQLRVKKPIEYKNVFDKPVKSTDSFFTLLAISNSYGYPRLGLAIAKKNIRKAVTRNLIKRVIKESFRLQQHRLINFDVVVLARRDAGATPPALLKKSLDKHWLKLVNKCNTC